MVLSNSSIDVSLDIEQEYFDCEASFVEGSETEDALDTSFCDDLQELIDSIKDDATSNDFDTQNQK